MTTTSTSAHIIRLANGRIKSPTTEATVAAIVQQAVAHRGKGGIVIHLHGGLVPYNAGLAMAEKLHPEYSNAGAYPIFFLWESGVFETLQNNLHNIGKRKFFKVVWKLVAWVLRSKIETVAGLRGEDIEYKRRLKSAIDAAIQGSFDELEALEPVETQLPKEPSAAEEQELLGLFSGDDEYATAAEDAILSVMTQEELQPLRGIRGGNAVRIPSKPLLDRRCVEELIVPPQQGQRGLGLTIKITWAVVKIVAKVIRRYRQGRQHGFHATIVEEILRAFYLGELAADVWDLMKEDTGDAFRKNGGGALFMDALAKSLAGAAELPRITIVGHSAGSIFATNMLRYAERAFTVSKDVRFDLIFLAPALTFAMCAKLVKDHFHLIRKVDGVPKKLALRMFTMEDQYERRDHLKHVYPCSLLYLIAGVLEPAGKGDMPIVGMQRFYDAKGFPSKKFKEIEVFRSLLGGSAGHVDHSVWSIAKGKAGFASGAIHHGDFDDNDATTLASLKHILRTGF